MAQQPDLCSNTKSLRLFRNINRPLGTPVSTGGGGGQVEKVCFETFSKVTTEVAERTDSGRLFQREGVQELKVLAPVCALILGMDRVIPLFDLSRRDGREVVIREQS